MNPAYGLPFLMATVDRWSDIEVIKVYNAEHTTKRDETHRIEARIVSSGEIKRQMLERVIAGREVRQKARNGEPEEERGQAVPSASKGKDKVTDVQVGAKPVKVSYHTAVEYLADPGHEIDDREMQYWDLLLHPSEEALALQRQLVERYEGVRMWAVESRDADWIRDALHRWERLL